jgi:hypothetical protein
LFLAALGSAIRARTHADEVTVFSSHRHRDVPAQADLVGFIANPLLLRLHLSSGSDLVSRAVQTIDEAFAHPHVPLAYGTSVDPELPPALAPPELFRVGLHYLIRKPPPDPPPGLRLEPAPIPLDETAHELMLFVIDRGDRWVVSFTADAALHDDASLADLSARLIESLEGLAGYNQPR